MARHGARARRRTGERAALIVEGSRSFDVAENRRTQKPCVAQPRSRVPPVAEAAASPLLLRNSPES